MPVVQIEMDLSADNGYIMGQALFSIDTEEDFSSDIGGTDGPIVTSAELYEFRIGDLVLNRYQVAEICGESHLREVEDSLVSPELLEAA